MVHAHDLVVKLDVVVLVAGREADGATRSRSGASHRRPLVNDEQIINPQAHALGRGACTGKGNMEGVFIRATGLDKAHPADCKLAIGDGIGVRAIRSRGSRPVDHRLNNRLLGREIATNVPLGIVEVDEEELPRAAYAVDHRRVDCRVARASRIHRDAGDSASRHDARACEARAGTTRAKTADLACGVVRRDTSRTRNSHARHAAVESGIRSSDMIVIVGSSETTRLEDFETEVVTLIETSAGNEHRRTVVCACVRLAFAG